MMMHRRSEILLNYVSAKLMYEALAADDSADMNVINDIEQMKKGITDEVFPGLFEEAFGPTLPHYVPVGVSSIGGSCHVVYVAERFLKPATAVSEASKKFGLAEPTEPKSLIMTKTFKRSDYLKYSYLIQKAREEREATTSSVATFLSDVYDDSPDDKLDPFRNAT